MYNVMIVVAQACVSHCIIILNTVPLKPYQWRVPVAGEYIQYNLSRRPLGQGDHLSQTTTAARTKARDAISSQMTLDKETTW